jgi:hypothetical protein
MPVEQSNTHRVSTILTSLSYIPVSGLPTDVLTRHNAAYRGPSVTDRGSSTTYRSSSATFSVHTYLGHI